jgi:hypothetical protein
MTEAGTADLRGRAGTSRAGLIGGLAAGLVYLVLLSAGRWSLLRRDSLGHFYDEQAHALLGGHLDVPAATLGPEAFIIDGRAYMYYGPVPALLRLPIAAITDRFDGRLTLLSMLLAFAVAMVFTYRLTARIRVLVRNGAPVTRLEQWATGIFVFVAGTGSVLTFLASSTIVYHEAELWGAALAIAAFDFIIAYLIAPTRQTLVCASVLATLAFLARGSVGAGPVGALALIFAASLFEPTRRLAGIAAGSRANWEWRRLLIAWVVPACAYMAVNFAKFQSLLRVPPERQILYSHPARTAALEATNNTMFGSEYAWTMLPQTLRPDGVRFTSLFPWVSFPPRAHVFVDASFDTIDLSASLTATMPLFFILSIVGLVGVVRARGRIGDNLTLACLRLPVLSAAICTIPTITIAFIAHRYLSDFMPLMFLLGAAGLHVVLAWVSAPGRARLKRVGVGALCVFAVLSVWANVGLALLYQRTLAPTLVNEWRLADFVDRQRSIHDVVPGGEWPDIRRGDVLPKPGPLQSIFVLGDCRAVYWSGGDAWRAIERTNSTGRWRARVTFAPVPGDAWQPLLTSGRPGAGSFIAARVLPDSRVQFGFTTDREDAEWLETQPFRIGPGPHEMDLVYDASTARVEARVGEKLVMDLPLLIRPAENVTLGRSDIGGPVSPRFAGEFTELPAQPTLCRKLTE